jgi:hypothetical protein
MLKLHYRAFITSHANLPHDTVNFLKFVTPGEQTWDLFFSFAHCPSEPQIIQYMLQLLPAIV